MLRQDTAGDPTGGRGLWTGQHLEEISGHLKKLGLSVCPNTVRRLLDQLGYALHANRKSLSGPQSPERDAQFQYLGSQREQFVQQGLPIISVDTKKKELVGCFKNAGRIWSQQARPVNDHDFPSLASGIGIPRGLYDLQANRGSVLVGTSHDTPEFAVDAIADWWRAQGRRRYPLAAELLILADSGGSNSARSRVWKYALQERLADPYGLAVTVCHYPTGASKWNPIEHRVFSEISKRCAGQPFTDYTTMVQLIAGTRTRTGLQVNCALSDTHYATKVKVTDGQMAALDLLKHTVLPAWNYTLFPRIIGINFCTGPKDLDLMRLKQTVPIMN
ncbi:conserved hypothetical protein [Verrucomicrobia bacterium]|nr:conserved hypothetical protein [Verrucomicrobiota bacterium]